jgi:hypothetical protein
MERDSSSQSELDSWLADIHQDALDHAEQIMRVRRAVGKLLAGQSRIDSCRWCGAKWNEEADGMRKPIRNGSCEMCSRSFRTLVDRVDRFLSKEV